MMSEDDEDRFECRKYLLLCRRVFAGRARVSFKWLKGIPRSNMRLRMRTRTLIRIFTDIYVRTAPFELDYR